MAFSGIYPYPCHLLAWVRENKLEENSREREKEKINACFLEDVLVKYIIDNHMFFLFFMIKYKKELKVFMEVR